MRMWQYRRRKSYVVGSTFDGHGEKRCRYVIIMSTKDKISSNQFKLMRYFQIRLPARPSVQHGQFAES
jgi:hypothetical protein